VLKATPRIIEGNYSYIFGEIEFNNPGYQQVVFPFNMFNQSFQQFVLLPGIQWQHSIFYGSPHQCFAGSPQATDSSRMPLEAREQYTAFSRNRSYIHFSVVYRSSVCQGLFLLTIHGQVFVFHRPEHQVPKTLLIPVHGACRQIPGDGVSMAIIGLFQGARRKKLFDAQELTSFSSTLRK
jgi:hypothetical protein